MLDSAGVGGGRGGKALWRRLGGVGEQIDDVCGVWGGF